MIKMDFAAAFHLFYGQAKACTPKLQRSIVGPLRYASGALSLHYVPLTKNVTVRAESAGTAAVSPRRVGSRGPNGVRNGRTGGTLCGGRRRSPAEGVSPATIDAGMQVKALLRCELNSLN